MSYAITSSTEKLHTKIKRHPGKSRGAAGGNASFLLIAVMFITGSAAAVYFRLPIKDVMQHYSYDVLVILVAMELFTNLIAETGIMQLLAIRIARWSGGRKRLCLIMFGGMMFLVSSVLNNITAVMVILPVVFVLLRTLEVDRQYIYIFFAAILALSNTGGAASPVGDFPAIIIMTSGITTFLGYLTRAFPLFALTSAVLLLVWGSCVKKEQDDGAVRRFAVASLKSQYKNAAIRVDVLKWLGLVFIGMFLAWSIVPQSVAPPEVIAVLGYVTAAVISSIKNVKVEQKMDLQSLLTIASFLFLAQVVSQTGVLNLAAAYLQNRIADPKLLVIAVMVITSLAAGLFSAGPAAAAMLPIIVQLCNGPLSGQSDWIAIAYAASICAGSSLFMWSATAGFILSGKVNETEIVEAEGDAVRWGVSQYWMYGLVNYAIQLSIALIAMFIIL